MNTSSARIIAASAVIADVAGVSMNPQALVADLFDLADEYGDDFEAVVIQVSKALSDIVANRVTTSSLKYDLSEWYSYHFQSSVTQGHTADLRIAFRREGDNVIVASFGCRHRPPGFYDKVRSRLLGFE